MLCLLFIFPWQDTHFFYFTLQDRPIYIKICIKLLSDLLTWLKVLLQVECVEGVNNNNISLGYQGLQNVDNARRRVWSLLFFCPCLFLFMS